MRTTHVDVCVDMYESPGFGDLPSGVSLADARDRCASSDARLCTEAEWEAACRGPLGALYPYGDTYRVGACVTEDDGPRTVGQRNACRSGFGTYDMSGNALEWVEEGFLKGGGHTADAFGARCGARAVANDQPDNVTGFRCCRTPDE